MRTDDNSDAVAASKPLASDLLRGAKAIAEYMGVTPGVVYRMVAAEQIPYFKKGELLFARKSQIEADFRADAAA